MSANVIPTFQVSQFSTNVELLLQQKGSMLADKVTTGSYVGKQASPVDQIGAVAMNAVTTRFQPITRTDASTDRRWVFPSDFDLAQQIDQFDKLRLLTDPESQYAQNAAYAVGRKKDELILTAMFAAASTGEAGATSTSFTSGNVIGVNTGGTDSKLNVPKLRAGLKILRANQVDVNDPIWCGLTADAHDALLNEIQIISSDFNGGDRPVLKDGMVTRFLGINFVLCEQITTTGAGTDDQSGSSIALPMWAQSGMHLGIWNDVSHNVTRREDLQGQPWQIYTSATFGATRLDEKKVIKIWSQI